MFYNSERERVELAERIRAWLNENIRYISFHPRIRGFFYFFMRLLDISEDRWYTFDDIRIEDGELVCEWMFDYNRKPAHRSQMITVVKGLFFTLCLNENELSEICDMWKYKCKTGIFSESEKEELRKLFSFIPSINEILDLKIRAIGDKRFVWHSDTKPSARNTITLYELSRRNDEELHNPVFVKFVGDIVEVES